MRLCRFRNESKTTACVAAYFRPVHQPHAVSRSRSIDDGTDFTKEDVALITSLPAKNSSGGDKARGSWVTARDSPVTSRDHLHSH